MPVDISGMLNAFNMLHQSNVQSSQTAAANQQKRAQAIGQVTGLLGMGVGAAFGGIPGAGLGGAIGQGLGSSLSGGPPVSPMEIANVGLQAYQVGQQQQRQSAQAAGVKAMVDRQREQVDNNALQLQEQRKGVQDFTTQADKLSADPDVGAGAMEAKAQGDQYLGVLDQQKAKIDAQRGLLDKISDPKIAGQLSPEMVGLLFRPEHWATPMGATEHTFTGLTGQQDVAPFGGRGLWSPVSKADFKALYPDAPDSWSRMYQMNNITHKIEPVGQDPMGNMGPAGAMIMRAAKAQADALGRPDLHEAIFNAGVQKYLAVGHMITDPTTGEPSLSKLDMSAVANDVVARNPKPGTTGAPGTLTPAPQIGAPSGPKEGAVRVIKPEQMSATHNLIDRSNVITRMNKNYGEAGKWTALLAEAGEKYAGKAPSPGFVQFRADSAQMLNTVKEMWPGRVSNFELEKALPIIPTVNDPPGVAKVKIDKLKEMNDQIIKNELYNYQAHGQAWTPKMKAWAQQHGLSYGKLTDTDGQQPQMPDTAVGSQINPIKVKTRDEVEALTPGTWYVGPKGQPNQR